MNKIEEAFQLAAKQGNGDMMRAIAERAVKTSKDPTERARWRKRAEQLRKGQMLKFSRAEVREVR